MPGSGFNKSQKQHIQYDILRILVLTGLVSLGLAFASLIYGYYLVCPLFLIYSSWSLRIVVLASFPELREFGIKLPSFAKLIEVLLRRPKSDEGKETSEPDSTADDD